MLVSEHREQSANSYPAPRPLALQTAQRTVAMPRRTARRFLQCARKVYAQLTQPLLAKPFTLTSHTLGGPLAFSDRGQQVTLPVGVGGVQHPLHDAVVDPDFGGDPVQRVATRVSNQGRLDGVNRLAGHLGGDQLDGELRGDVGRVRTRGRQFGRRECTVARPRACPASMAAHRGMKLSRSDIAGAPT